MTNHVMQSILHTLAGPIPTPFFGDPAQAQQFINEFGQLERANRCHPLITRPDLRVELVLVLIYEDPMTTAWKRTIHQGRSTEWIDKSIWDKFFNSFCTAWIDDTPTPVTQAPSAPAPINTVKLDFVPSTIDPAPVSSPLPATLPTPIDGPLASVPATTDPLIPVPVDILEPAMTPSTVVSDLPPLRPLRSPRRPVSPKIAQPTLPTFKENKTQASPLPPTENKTEKTLLASGPAPPAHAVCHPLMLTATSSPTPVKEKEGETLAPCLVPAPALPLAPTKLRIRKRKRCDTSDLGDTHTHKHTFTLHRAAPDPGISAPSFPVPYAPPPHRPRPAPGDPSCATSLSIKRVVVVEDDNVSKRGVETFDYSGFARVLAQETADTPPQTPPRARHVPCDMPKQLRRPSTTSRSSPKHHNPNTKAATQHIPPMTYATVSALTQ
ncbi:hypothetical protein EDB86DRAFT_3077174 [Lactarius hatsudake]|nr:hypothetical protein EDB86DRAFT_3077174 [Lactarius hatsudake]